MQISDILSIFAVIVTLIGIVRQWTRDKSTVLVEEATARKTDADIAALLDTRTVVWIEKQEQKLVAQDEEITKLKARIEDLEKCNTERQKREKELQQYIEYLLDGIRVLIRQVVKHNSSPDFDPIGLEDFLSRKTNKQNRLDII